MSSGFSDMLNLNLKIQSNLWAGLGVAVTPESQLASVARPEITRGYKKSAGWGFWFGESEYNFVFHFQGNEVTFLTSQMTD